MELWHVTIRTARPTDALPLAEAQRQAVAVHLAAHVAHVACSPTGCAVRLYVVADSSATACENAVKALSDAVAVAGLSPWLIDDLHARVHFTLLEPVVAVAPAA